MPGIRICNGNIATILLSLQSTEHDGNMASPPLNLDDHFFGQLRSCAWTTRKAALDGLAEQLAGQQAEAFADDRRHNYQFLIDELTKVTLQL